MQSQTTTPCRSWLATPGQSAVTTRDAVSWPVPDKRQISTSKWVTMKSKMESFWLNKDKDGKKTKKPQAPIPANLGATSPGCLFLSLQPTFSSFRFNATEGAMAAVHSPSRRPKSLRKALKASQVSKGARSTARVGSLKCGHPCKFLEVG